MKYTFLSLIIILTTSVSFAQKDTVFIKISKDQLQLLVDGKGQAGIVMGKDGNWYVTLFARSYYDGIHTPTINSGVEADSTNGVSMFEIGVVKKGFRLMNQDPSQWDDNSVITKKFFNDNTDSVTISRRVTTAIGMYAIDSIKIPYLDTTFRYEMNLVAESGATDSSATGSMTLLIKRNAAGKYIIAGNDFNSIHSKSFFMTKLYWFITIQNGIPYIYVQQFLQFPPTLPTNKKYIKWKVSRETIL